MYESVLLPKGGLAVQPHGELNPCVFIISINDSKGDVTGVIAVMTQEGSVVIATGTQQTRAIDHKEGNHQ